MKPTQEHLFIPMHSMTKSGTPQGTNDRMAPYLARHYPFSRRRARRGASKSRGPNLVLVHWLLGCAKSGGGLEGDHPIDLS